MTTFTAVKTTGIYCRSGCGASPLASNTTSFALAAGAEAAGYRACFRCRPYRASPPDYWSGPEVVCRAVRMILKGALDQANERDLAVRLGVSGRHLRRLFQTHLGVTPTELARSSRAHFARRLLDDTDLSVTEIAYAAGFGSVRQFNRICTEIFRAPPTDLRAKRRKADRLAADGGLTLRLPYDGALDWGAMLSHFAARAIPGVEHVEGATYRRTIEVEGNPGVIEIGHGDECLVLTAHLPHWDGLMHLTRHARSIFGLDSGHSEAESYLGRQPVVGPLVRAKPGLRVPGTWDGYETGVRAIIGQGITVAGATTITGRLVKQHGTLVPGLDQMGLSQLFPSPDRLRSADLSGLGLPTIRQEAIRAFSSAVMTGDVHLDGEAGLESLIASLTSIRGLGQWTANYIALRTGEPDAFPGTDLGLQRTFHRLTGRSDLHAAAVDWSPWRSLAAFHLWMASDRIENREPLRSTEDERQLTRQPAVFARSLKTSD